MRNGQSERFGNIKEKNLKLLFNMICDRPGISRAQLSRDTGLSKPAVSELADELVNSGYVRMSGTDESGKAGRRAVCLEPDPSYGVFISIALGERTADVRVYDFAPWKKTQLHGLGIWTIQGMELRRGDRVLFERLSKA